MATFVDTTLTKRTGTSTTVFVPGIKTGNAGVMFESSALAGFGRQLQMSAARTQNMRRTSIRVQVPQLTADGFSVLRFAQAKLEILVPDGISADDVNDLVGYIESACSTSKTNLNDLLVDGQGVF